MVPHSAYNNRHSRPPMLPKSRNADSAFAGLTLPPAEYLGESFLRGRYAEIYVAHDRIAKINLVDVPHDIGSASREAVARAADVERYLHELIHAGVTIPPETAVSVDLTSRRLPAVVIQSRKIPAPHNLIQIVESNWDERLERIDEMLKELLKVVSTQSGRAPIGYDSGLDNFVSWRGSCYLVDVYPPRLGFTTSADAITLPKAQADLLINYPERNDLDAERTAQMRRFYYTPHGAIEHFATWSISAVLNDAPHHHRSAEFIQRQEIVTTRICASLTALGRDDLAGYLKGYLRSTHGQQELSYRFSRTPQRIEAAIHQWRRSCHLF